ncbi:MAG: sulfatase-like hydrolase/transferase [Acidobacteria bacterium]|nr:sulfatase-like hydrolase/transferase [Acidobacteriota bacterium]
MRYLLGLFLATAALAQPRPNVIFVLVDDMGYADTTPYGNPYNKTPNVERMAREGMRFTQAYAAAPNCSPTRASILTGHWPARTGVTQYLPGNDFPWAKLLQAELPEGLPLDETILAQPLGRAGYATASVGKWHLGGGEYLPENRGFDLNFAGGPWGSHNSMFAPYKGEPILAGPPGEYLTDRLAAFSESFIQANRDQPFFLYLPLYSVHGPVEAKQSRIDGFAGKPDPTGGHDPTYAAMVEGVDWIVGRLMDKLEELNLTERTAIFFFSDNGGTKRADNRPLRSVKGWLYEGGVREPLIVRWPGTIPAGRVDETPVTSIDFYPTILSMTGVADAAGHVSDGVDLMPLLRGEGRPAPRTLYWHYPHYSNAGSPPSGALREGDLKLIEWFEDDRVELFDLAADVSEQKDLAQERPAEARRLLEKLRAWRKSVGAKPALPNPNYDPAKVKRRK